MRCAVENCTQTYEKNLSSGNVVHFLRFPSNQEAQKRWIEFCGSISKFNIETTRICSLHFEKDDFERNLRYEMGFCKRYKPQLKPGVLPTLRTRHSAKGNSTEVCSEKPDDILYRIQTLRDEVKNLRLENEVLKRQKDQITSTVKDIQRQNMQLLWMNENMEKSLKALFTENQINKIKNGDKRRNWDVTDITQSITLYSTSAKAYRLLQKRNFPLPSIRTLQRWTQKINMCRDKFNKTTN